MRRIIPQVKEELGLQLLDSSSAKESGYNPYMPEFRFYHPIEVRYGDLDPQGHVNNAKFMTYMEQARVQYIRNLGLWDASSFLDVGFILAEAKVTFLTPIRFTDRVQVGVRVSRLGNKSLDMQYRLEEAQSGQELATGSSVQVAYEYRQGKTIPIPEGWRLAIQEFESLD
jgi:acyl-CoA thioester hydrolase